MAAAATGSGSITSRIKNLLRSPPAINLRRSRATAKAGTERITLDKVIGITASSSSSLACDLTTGVVAYPAGCVVVLCNPKKNKQTHILNASRKAVSALAFSPDGKYLVTGESGHMPAVRVWDVSDKVQVAELQCHKYGVSCVSFSPNLKYIVSVGYQHDKLVNVWDWKKNSIVASNKVSSKVTAVSFSEDSSFFVTTGNRHVKFWYLNESKACKANITVPLIGRSALLGELHNNIFSGVACGKGKMAGSIFCITSSGLLCQFNGKRLLDKWLDLKTSAANCISATEDFIFCGCANGTLKLFNPVNLQFVTNLPKPHYLGVDVAAGIEPSHLVCKKTDALYPDTIAVAFDPSNRWLSCVYSDHSLYVWDTKDVQKFGKVYSALYHSSSVWSVEVYPELENSSQACLPSASFLTCSSDNTIRLWNVDAASGFQFTSFHKNIYSMDLIKVVYVGDNIQYLQDTTSNPDRTENGGPSDIKSGIRVITISPDGQHLASGDRMGTLRIFDLQFLDELMKVEAHDSEILCLEYSKPETGMNLLATASRDRLIHILNVDKQYSLVQTLDDHSSSITAVKFAANDNVKMVSCGVDKSIYFRTAQKSVDGIQFTRTHHVVGKTSLYDMDIDIMRKYVAIGCQDRNIRVFTIGSGKQKKCFKGSQSEDGILLKVQMDPSGTFVATSCSDKNISIFDFYTGECVASMFGHSEIVTGMKFTNDCKYLITVSGDSCIFIWRLDTQLTNCMRHRLSEIKQIAKKDKTPPTKTSAPIRRETFMVQKVASEDQEDDTSEDDVEDVSLQTPLKEPMDQDKTEDAIFLMTNGKLPLWAKRLEAGDGCVQDRPGNSTVEAFQPRGRWAERMDKDLIHSILGRKQLEEYCATPTPGSLSIAQGLLSSHFKEQDKFTPRNLDSFLEMMELSPSLLTKESTGRPSSICLEDADSTFSREVDTVEMELSAPMFYPMQNEHSTSTENVYQVKEPPKKVLESESEWEIVRSVENSPDSAYSMDSGSNEQQQDDSDSVGQLSSDGHSSGLEEEEEQCCAVPQESHAVKTPDQEKFLKHNFETLANEFSHEKFDGTLNDLQPNVENESNFFLNPRLSISARFLSRCQKNSRMTAAFPPKVQQKLQHLPDARCKSLQLRVEINPFIDGHGSELESSFDGTKHLRNEEMNQTVEREYIRSEWDIESMSSSAEKSLALEVKDTAPNNGRSHLCKRSASVIDLVQGEERASSDSFIAAAQSSLQNVHVSEGTKQRHSLCSKMDMLAATLSKEMSKNKLGKPRSYMHPTASFKAKMSRSASMGENLHLKALGQSRGTSLPNSRAVSTVDLTESMKGSTPNEDNPNENFKEKNPPKETLQILSYGNHQARANLTLNLSKIHTDRLLMPPPIANGFAVTKVKQKLRAGQDSTQLSTSAVTPTQPASLAKTDQNVCEKHEENGSIPNMNSFTILKKATGNLEHCNSSPDGTEHTLEKFHSCNSIPLQPQHDSISPNRDAVSSNSITIPEGNGFQKDVAASLRGSMGIEEKPINEADLAVSVENCEYVVTELQDTLQKALQLYNKVLSSEDTPERKSKMMAILCGAFSSARKHLNSIECLPISLFASEAPENGKVTALLEHYSEMLIKMVAQNLQLQH